ncbi:tyrosine recombinase XerC [Nocardia tengchongensis]|uniref:site-specific integrase n=1 Tax=Nocardia tengchongensis TaxID=2055889 RepID=UPI0036A0F05A
MGLLSIAEAGEPKYLANYLADVWAEFPSLAYTHYVVLSGVFKFLKKKGLFDYSPMKLVEPPKKAGGQQRAIKADERDELIRLLTVKFAEPRTAKWLLPFTLTLLGTGIRPGEGFALRWEDLDGLGGDRAVAYIGATVARSQDRPTYRQTKRKGGAAPYNVTLPSWLTIVLRNWRTISKTDDEGLVFRSPNNSGNSGIIFTSGGAETLAASLRGSLVSWITFGNFRDTVATEVTGRTGDSRRASAQLEHSEGSTMATRHYIDQNGYVRDVVDNADALELLFQSR